MQIYNEKNVKENIQSKVIDSVEKQQNKNQAINNSTFLSNSIETIKTTLQFYQE